jgi:hypothetical protein
MPQSRRPDPEQALIRTNPALARGVDHDSAPLIMALQRSGIDFRRSLYARSSEERIGPSTISSAPLENAIEFRRNHEPERATLGWKARAAAQLRTRIGPPMAGEITFSVDDYPPAKNEAKSMLAARHVHATRVLALLRAAQRALGDTRQPLFPNEGLSLELVVVAPDVPPSDATNYLGGVADVLEAKGKRGPLEHLDDLRDVAVYSNDRQIHEVHYRYEQGQPPRYDVRIWVLNEDG